MTTFSIVIPTYRAGDYLDACLDSVAMQDYGNWEALVVLDGPDCRCAELVRDRARRNKRFRLIEKPVNEGLHLARMTGAHYARNEYVLFLDADDELLPGVLRSLADAVNADANADIVHFSLKAKAADGFDSTTAMKFEQWANADLPPHAGPEMFVPTFCRYGGYMRDWNMAHRLFTRGLLAEAFPLMTNTRLERAEDAYEYLVVSSLANREISRNDIVGYRYNIGRGVTNAHVLSAAEFARQGRQYAACCEAARAYGAQASGIPGISDAVDGLVAKLHEAVGTDWHERVAESDKQECARVLAETIGAVATAEQLARVARDDAYEALQRPEARDMLTEHAGATLHLADALLEEHKAIPSARCVRYRYLALVHLGDIAKSVEHEIERQNMQEQSIRIFVSTHKEVATFKSDILQAVQVGTARSDNRLACARFFDNEGENISELNPQYCELTTQYWAWKNVNADYYGFCHYRRYFDFSETNHAENSFGEVPSQTIDARAQQEYGLDDKTIRNVVEGCDVITTRFQNLRTFPIAANTPAEQYAEAPHLKSEDLDAVVAVLKRLYPDYAEDADTFLNGNHACFCNMFIMKKDLFLDYSTWLFAILDEFMHGVDFSTYSKEGLRTPGHLAERLLNVYLLHLKRTQPELTFRELQCVHFADPGSRASLAPLFVERPHQDVIPVVFAADNAYVPMVATSIASLLSNASPTSYYDIVLLERGITNANKKLLGQMVENYPWGHIRFIDANPFVAQYALSTNNAHIGNETYYRFLIQDLLPFYDKVLYLDSDLVIEGDVSELFAIDLGDQLLAAAHDIDYLGNLNMKDGIRRAYTRDVLHMENPYRYFQAGVLVMNTRELRKLHTVDEWLTIASNPSYIYNDQDVLNAACENRVVYLNYAWNVMHDCGNRVANVFSFAPGSAYDAYLASRADPKIIHYAGFEKPWKFPLCDYSAAFWKYAHLTPFYEQLLFAVQGASGGYAAPYAPHEPAMSDTNPLRRVLDPLMPLGTRRREVFKALGRLVQGKH
jgi:lipopolysaccharide biosynthesis glycosyltransferase